MATPETEEAFVEIAKHSTASQIARLFRWYGRCLADPQAAREQRRHVHRSETIDGMVRIEIVLPPEEAAVVWEAMDAAMDTAQRADAGSELESGHAPDEGALAVTLQPGPQPACERVEFIDQRNHVIQRFPATSANLDELEHWLREVDVHIDPALTEPKWDGRPMDLQDSLTWMLMGPDPRLRKSA